MSLYVSAVCSIDGDLKLYVFYWLCLWRQHVCHATLCANLFISTNHLESNDSEQINKQTKKTPNWWSLKFLFSLLWPRQDRVRIQTKTQWDNQFTVILNLWLAQISFLMQLLFVLCVIFFLLVHSSLSSSFVSNFCSTDFDVMFIVCFPRQSSINNKPLTKINKWLCK